MSKVNEITTWQKGRFIAGVENSHLSVRQREAFQMKEALVVRPYPKGNPICECKAPEDSEWIAERLNIAAKLEALIKDAIKNKEQSVTIDELKNLLIV